MKLVHLVGFITKQFVTMHGHMSRCTVTCQDAWSHVTMHGHMLRCTVTCYDARSYVTMHGHMSRCTVTCYDARSHERKNVLFFVYESPVNFATTVSDCAVVEQRAIIAVFVVRRR